MLEHKQVYITCPWNDQEVGIDEGIVELIRELWRLGIRTTTCCQDASRGKRPGHKDVWIDFECEAFRIFARIIAEVVGIQWHIMPRPNPLDKSLMVIGVSFPGDFYCEVLTYFKKERGGTP